MTMSHFVLLSRALINHRQLPIGGVHEEGAAADRKIESPCAYLHA